ncbi:hypothetical protein VNI00_012281 [Paramarasmius palmivorus]|uniref:F-box domain-containing protein n=1 Tax=Paramarasmius palmivorus TaxID=297713 RepID=A0AAW0C7R8_9AGAR
MADKIRKSSRLREVHEKQITGDEAGQPGKSRRGHETDSDDDYDDKPRKKRANYRKPKKREQQKNAKTRRMRGAYRSTMVDLPLDIILVICGFITTPRDFVSLMLVNHTTYNLLSTHAMATWTGMRAEYWIPDPLPGMSEAEWAVLLLGESKCEACRHDKRYAYPAFMFKKRLCTTCLGKRALKEADIRHEYSECGEEILDIVPHTETHRNKYYSLEEVGKVFEELKASKLQNPAERKAYIESRKATRDQHNSLYCRARYWVENYDLREKDVLCANRAKAIEERFVELGYCEKDAQAVSRLGKFCVPKELNNHEWNLIKDRALDEMNVHRVMLFCIGYGTGIFSQRRELVRETYTRFKMSLPPGKWLRTPTVGTVCKFPEVLKVIVMPDKAVCTLQDVIGALESHRFAIENWTDPIHLVGSVDHDTVTKISKTAFGPTFTGEYPKMLDDGPRHARNWEKLAIYGFQCHSLCLHPFAFTSLDVALCHKARTTRQGFMQLLPDQQSIEVTIPHYVHIQLIYLSGLRIDTATADDMDNRGDFFKCLECAASADLEKRASSIVTWRECVTRHRHTQDDPDGIKFEVVHEEIEDVRKYWTCARCNVHVEALVTRREVCKHLLDVHSIAEPSVPGDFMYAGEY